MSETAVANEAVLRVAITVYGASDDLIEVDGDVDEEFNALTLAGSDDGGLLAFEDGTVLRIQYTDQGVWRIDPVIVASGTGCELVPAPENDEDNYSDVVTLRREEPIGWVVLGSEMAVNK